MTYRLSHFATFTLSALFALAPLSGCSTRQAPQPTGGSIGAAKMLPDGTITLHLRAEHASAVGDSLIQVGPSDPRHKEILAHVGGLRPGEEKQVPPWPASK
jgi:hypothetical protein